MQASNREAEALPRVSISWIRLSKYLEAGMPAAPLALQEEMGSEPIFFWFYLFQQLVNRQRSYSDYMTAKTLDLNEIVSRTVEGMGYEFVEFERLPGALLRVTIDSEREGGISVNDCEAVSDQLTALFTAEDVDYQRLEVTSPGVERELKRAKDWKRFSGSLAHVELYSPMHAEGFPEAGRRKLDGRILSISGEPGSERIGFEFTGEKPFRTPSQAARERIATRKGRHAAEPAVSVKVEFPLSEVEHAHLIAELDFKGGRR